MARIYGYKNKRHQSTAPDGPVIPVEELKLKDTISITPVMKMESKVNIDKTTDLEKETSMLGFPLNTEGLKKLQEEVDNPEKEKMMHREPVLPAEKALAEAKATANIAKKALKNRKDRAANVFD